MHDVCKVDLGVTNANDILQDSDINMANPLNKIYLYDDIYHLLLLLVKLFCILLSVIREISSKEGMLIRYVTIKWVISGDQINYLSPPYQSPNNSANSVRYICKLPLPPCTRLLQWSQVYRQEC